MDKDTLNVMYQSLEKAKEELDKAMYLEECGSNSGIRKMNSNKVDWLKWVVYLAEAGLAGLEPTTTGDTQEPKTDFQKAITLFEIIKNNF